MKYGKVKKQEDVPANQNKAFKRVIEDFECEHCKTHVRGRGFTDHCPMCLWSKHVDINPGDRRSDCRGPMEPQWTYLENENFIIMYKCLKCGAEKRMLASSEDDKEALFRFSRAFEP